jgi:hypothetical protein
MVIISGTRMAGKVDVVPRVGYVSTRFFHLYYVPLIPLQSFLVFSEDGDEINGVPLSLNIKSILVGWLRGLSWLALIVAPIFAVILLGDKHPLHAGVALIIWILAALTLPLLHYVPGIREASYERAIELANRTGLSPETNLMLEVAYGRLNADQAERELVRLIESERPTEQATY